MSTLQAFDAKRSAETDVFTFDLANLLTVGETISQVTFTAVVSSASAVPDANPSAILSGTGTISSSKVSQKITAGVVGATYVLEAAATLSTGRLLQAAALLPVADPLS